jgi:hypothetical protein
MESEMGNNWAKWLFYSSIGANVLLAGVVIAQSNTVRRTKNDLVTIQTAASGARGATV